MNSFKIVSILCMHYAISQACLTLKATHLQVTKCNIKKKNLHFNFGIALLSNQ